MEIERGFTEGGIPDCHCWGWIPPVSFLLRHFYASHVLNMRRMVAVMTMNVGYFMSVLGGTFMGELLVGRYAQTRGMK